MSKVVAVDGDCEATAAPGYIATPIIYSISDKVIVSGKSVIFKATCTFVDDPGVPPVVPPDIVELTPTITTKLQAGFGGVGKDVLRETDSKTSAKGNILKVKDGILNKLKSA